MTVIRLIVKTKTKKYPVLIGSNIINQLSKILKVNSVNYKKCLLIIDKKIPNNMKNKVINNFKKNQLFKYVLYANVKNKNQKKVNEILNILINKNFSSKDLLISIGGGIMEMLICSSLFKREYNQNLPTTLLAQVDSSIGGKTEQYKICKI